MYTHMAAEYGDWCGSGSSYIHGHQWRRSPGTAKVPTQTCPCPRVTSPRVRGFLHPRVNIMYCNMIYAIIYL